LQEDVDKKFCHTVPWQDGNVSSKLGEKLRKGMDSVVGFFVHRLLAILCDSDVHFAFTQLDSDEAALLVLTKHVFRTVSRDANASNHYTILNTNHTLVKAGQCMQQDSVSHTEAVFW
jgi:hypothetical protein